MSAREVHLLIRSGRYTYCCVAVTKRSTFSTTRDATRTTCERCHAAARLAGYPGSTLPRQAARTTSASAALAAVPSCPKER
jgi:hypothetical protein